MRRITSVSSTEHKRRLGGGCEIGRTASLQLQYPCVSRVCPVCVRLPPPGVFLPVLFYTKLLTKRYKRHTGQGSCMYPGHRLCGPSLYIFCTTGKFLRGKSRKMTRVRTSCHKTCAVGRRLVRLPATGATVYRWCLQTLTRGQCTVWPPTIPIHEGH